MITVHASGGRAMLEAAAEEIAVSAARFHVPKPALVAVTVLTSLDDAALVELGCERTAAEQVSALATMARDAGCDGVVCSPEEAAGCGRFLATRRTW